MTNGKPQTRAETSDLISRTDVLGYIDRLDTCGLGKGKSLEYIRKYVEKADSVSAERVGEWIEVEDWDGGVHYQCSQCKDEYILFDGTPLDNDYNYCPNCGAKMEG